MTNSCLKLIIILLLVILLCSCSETYNFNLKAGKTALNEGKYEEALRLFKIAKDDKPKEKEAQILYSETEIKLMNLNFEKKLVEGQKLIEAGKIEEAITFLNDLNNREKDNNKINKEFLDLLNIYLKESNVDKSIIDVKKLISEDKYEEATNILEKITEADTVKKEQFVTVKDLLAETKANKAFILAKNNFEKGNYVLAISGLTNLLDNQLLLIKLPKLKSTAEDYLQKSKINNSLVVGKQAYNEGKYDFAIESLTYVINYDPNNKEVINMIAQAEIKKQEQQYEQNAKDFLKQYSKFINLFANVIGKYDSDNYGSLEYAKNTANDLYFEMKRIRLPSNEFDTLHTNFVAALKFSIDTISSTQQAILMNPTTSFGHELKRNVYIKAFESSSYMVRYIEAYSKEQQRLYKKFGLQ